MYHVYLIEMKVIHSYTFVIYTKKSMSILNDYVNYDEIIIQKSLFFEDIL